MFCRSLFVLLSFFLWPLCFLFFFDIRILIATLVSSNSSRWQCTLINERVSLGIGKSDLWGIVTKYLWLIPDAYMVNLVQYLFVFIKVRMFSHYAQFNIDCKLLHPFLHGYNRSMLAQNIIFPTRNVLWFWNWLSLW